MDASQKLVLWFLLHKSKFCKFERQHLQRFVAISLFESSTLFFIESIPAGEHASAAMEFLRRRRKLCNTYPLSRRVSGRILNENQRQLYVNYHSQVSVHAALGILLNGSQLVLITLLIVLIDFTLCLLGQHFSAFPLCETIPIVVIERRVSRSHLVTVARSSGAFNLIRTQSIPWRLPIRTNSFQVVTASLKDATVTFTPRLEFFRKVINNPVGR